MNKKQEALAKLLLKGICILFAVVVLFLMEVSGNLLLFISVLLVICFLILPKSVTDFLFNLRKNYIWKIITEFIFAVNYHFVMAIFFPLIIIMTMFNFPESVQDFFWNLLEKISRVSVILPLMLVTMLIIYCIVESFF